MSSTYIQNILPYKMGFSMPAEWAEHAATWTSFPFENNDELWHGQVEQVRDEFAEFIKTMAKFETVHLQVKDKETEKAAKNRIGENPRVVYHLTPLDDIWFRDNGPLFVKKNDSVSFVKWEFNSWGEKFNWQKDNLVSYQVADHLKMDYFKTNIVLEGGSLDVNGAGVALTTQSCLLSNKRNPHLTMEDYNCYLNNYLGIKKTLWLVEGLEGDHTDGHIDTIVRFVNENTILYSITNDKSDKNYAIMQRNFEVLKTFTDLNDRPFHLVPLVLPEKSVHLNGERLPLTYANFYIGNGFVLVPLYGDAHDEIALSTIRSVFPKREVIGLSSRLLITGGGSFHCTTQQQPVGHIWKNP